MNDDTKLCIRVDGEPEITVSIKPNATSAEIKAAVEQASGGRVTVVDHDDVAWKEQERKRAVRRKQVRRERANRRRRILRLLRLLLAASPIDPHKRDRELLAQGLEALLAVEFGDL